MSRRRTRDKTSGSRTFNRLDFQISQGILFSIDLFDSCDYLIALDYYDDLAVIEIPDNHSIISYYQVKTTEDRFTLNTILKEEWLVDLYDHLSNDDGFDEVGKLGLITNCRIRNTTKEKDETSYINNAPGTTQLSTLGNNTADLIKRDIAEKLDIEISEVDLSKLAIIRSTLDIHSHETLAEKCFTDFVGKKLGNIGIQVIQAAYESLRSKFTACQGVELPDYVEKEEIQSRKCISKNVMDETLQTISEIDFPLIERVLQLVPKNEKQRFSVAYATAISDNIRAAENTTTVQNRIKHFIGELHLHKPFMTWDNACAIRDKYYEIHNFEFELPLRIDEYYVLVMAFVALHHL